MSTVISVEDVSKRYRLGVIGYGSLKDDLSALWAMARGKEDPHVPIGEEGRLSRKGEFWALRDVSFEVQKGERLGIIGKNGAGKSTLLKILSQITAPTKGRIKIKGRIASLLEVGTGFHPELSGRENIFLNGAILGMKRQEVKKKFDQIVEFSGISEFIDTPVKRYSSGMYVRLAFSVAAHLDSDILILDEVLAVGDADFQKKCLSNMENGSQEQGRTVLFVSHSLAAIKKLCDKAVYLSKGKKIIYGETNKVIETYTDSLNVNRTQAIDFSHLERSGSGECLVTGCYLLDNPTNTVAMGEKLQICFDIKNVFKKKIKIDLGFHLQNSLGISPFVDYMNYHQETLEIVDDCSVVFEWARMALRPGKYDVGCRLVSEGRESDWIRGFVLRLSVVEGDFYRTGSKGFVEGDTVLAVDGQWRIK